MPLTVSATFSARWYTFSPSNENAMTMPSSTRGRGRMDAGSMMARGRVEPRCCQALGFPAISFPRDGSPPLLHGRAGAPRPNRLGHGCIIGTAARPIRQSNRRAKRPSAQPLASIPAQREGDTRLRHVRKAEIGEYKHPSLHVMVVGPFPFGAWDEGSKQPLDLHARTVASC